MSRCPVDNCDCRFPTGQRGGDHSNWAIPARADEEFQPGTGSNDTSIRPYISTILNEKFAHQALRLKEECREGLSAILVLHNSCLYLGTKMCGSLDLKKYDTLKGIAHGLIYYSIKHKVLYSGLSDLCEDLRARYCIVETEPYWKWSLEKLMREAAKEYSSQLHKLVQTVRSSKRFGGQWPASMLVLVSGPTSPRYGHPAMQYFARLTNTLYEIPKMGSRSCLEVEYRPEEPDKYPDRKLLYIENADSASQALEIGVSLLTEDTVYSHYLSMKTDILARPTGEYLRQKCRKK